MRQRLRRAIYGEPLKSDCSFCRRRTFVAFHDVTSVSVNYPL